MATRVRLELLTKWVMRNGGWEPEFLGEPLAGIIETTDITNQVYAAIPPTPNIYIVEVKGLTSTQATTLAVNIKYVIISTEQYEDSDGSPRAGGDRETKLNQAALTTLKTTIKTRFPAILDADLTDDRDGGRDLFTAKNLTRGELAERIAMRCRRYGKTR